MAKVKWDRKAPFDENGSLMHYPETGWRCKEIDWRDVEEFKATLTYVTFRRGRSAAYLILQDENGNYYPMFMTEFDKIIPLLKGGKLTGRWTIAKRGTNFGIKFVGKGK